MLRILLLAVLLSVSGMAEASSMDNFRSKLMTSAVSMYFSSKGYGKVENVTVDTTKRTLNFILLPEGEAQKLTIAIGYYHTEVIDKEDTLVLQKIQTNRIWLTRFFADHMEEGIKIPLGVTSKGFGGLLLNL
ncbi:MAG: hypothetical protein NT103_00280 [Campylobacterales bacterium]|nr:hypothetical protein [Campylobacterales bacterium]